ncbi:MAG: phosphotransferase [Antricoccus sp.]
MNKLPVLPTDFDAAFIEAAMNAPPGTLARFSFDPVGTGQVCDSYRFTCQWTQAGPPSSFIAKCPSADEASRAAAALFHLYSTEVGWYSDIAAHTQVRRPMAYQANIAADGSAFVLMLEDMAPAIQGDQLAGATVQQVRAALSEAAALHAWRPPAGDFTQFSWLNHGGSNREVLLNALPAIYPQFRERFADLLSTDILDLGHELIVRLERYFDHEQAEICLQHSDLRIDNILYDQGTDRAVVVDWQTLAIGTSAGDVAYLLGTSFADGQERRDCELPLLDEYLDRRAQIGQAPDRTAFMNDIRRFAFAGFIMAIIASNQVVQTERGDRMFAAMAARPAQMAIDWDSLASI